MSAAHTPTPWRTHNSGQPDNVTMIKGADNTIVADVFGYDTSDAAFIVEACNAHDSLKAEAALASSLLAQCESLKAQNAELVLMLQTSADALERAITMATAGAAGRGAGTTFAPSDSELLSRLNYELNCARAALANVKGD